jgi:hypothetical protein
MCCILEQFKYNSYGTTVQVLQNNTLGTELNVTDFDKYFSIMSNLYSQNRSPANQNC